MHLLEIEITTMCDQNCEYCYNRGYKNQNMDFEEIVRYFKFAEKYGVELVVLSGGEASLHPEFEKICDYLKKNRPEVKRIVVQSNGYIKNIPYEKLKVFDSIHLSYELDSTTVRTHSTEQNLNLAKFYVEHGIHSYLFSTITKENICNIDNIVEKANSENVDVGFNICCDTGKNSSLLLTKEQKFEICKKMNKLSKDGKILPFKNPMVSIINDTKSEIFIGVKGGCTAGIASCVVSPYGEVYPCPFFRKSVGNTREKNLEDIWLNSEILKIFRSRKLFDEPCGNCEYLSYCGGCRKAAYERTSRLQGADVTCFKDCVSLD